MKKYALIPQSCDRAESFYNKATIIEYDNGKKVFKAEQKSGYIETLENGVKVGYDKRGSRWHANELTTGFGICSEKSKKALVEKIHELEKWGKLEHINRMLEREADDLRTNTGRAAKCIAEAYAS